jgi:hypothetical protein
MRSRIVVPVVVLAALAGCGSTKSPAVPSLPGSSAGPAGSADPGGRAGKGEPRATGAAGDFSPERRQKLHDAADCIRRHGIPTYADPVLTGDGHVYTDARSYQGADQPTLTAVDQACGQLVAAAGFQPNEEAPAPPALLQAGVKAAQCMRAHGLPDFADPTSTTMFTPGHGFGITNPNSMPPGGKQNPVFRSAIDACKPLLDEENRLSTLEQLGHA